MEEEIPMILKNDIIQFHEERLIDLEQKNDTQTDARISIRYAYDSKRTTIEYVPTEYD